MDQSAASSSSDVTRASVDAHVVESVVNDLVNFCVYEIGDYAFTPSVPKTARKISHEFDNCQQRSAAPPTCDQPT